MFMFGRKNRAAPPAIVPDESRAVTPEERPFEHALTFEASKIQMIERSERKAWRVATGAIVVALLLALAIFLMLPLKENTPYVIRVDNATGIPDIVTAMDTKGIQFDEAIDKYWLAQYVRARETFDWYTIQKDYDAVGLLSSPRIGAEYAALFEGSNAIDKKYGNDVRVTVEVISVTPNGKGIGTVRFRKTMKRTEDAKSSGTVTNWVATIGYEYRNPTLIKESARLINPFGFQVLSYRTDPEMGRSQ